MEKIYIPGCIGPIDCPEDLYEALNRAKLWFRVNRMDFVIHITSRNTDAPLTTQERDRLCDILTVGKCPYRLVFDN